MQISTKHAGVLTRYRYRSGVFLCCVRAVVLYRITVERHTAPATGGLEGPMKLNVRRWLVFLTILFVLFSIYNQPASSGESVGTFLGDLGDFLGNAFDSTAEFLGGVSD